MHGEHAHVQHYKGAATGKPLSWVAYKWQTSCNRAQVHVTTTPLTFPPGAEIPKRLSCTQPTPTSTHGHIPNA
jgi:hypothetical protein